MKTSHVVLVCIVVAAASVLITAGVTVELVTVAVNKQRDDRDAHMRLAREKEVDRRQAKLYAGKDQALLDAAKDVRNAKSPEQLAWAVRCYADVAEEHGGVIFQDDNWAPYAIPAKYCNKWYAEPVASVVLGGGGTFGADPKNGLWFDSAHQLPKFTQNRVMLIRYQYVNGLAITPVQLCTKEPYIGPCPKIAN